MFLSLNDPCQSLHSIHSRNQSPTVALEVEGVDVGQREVQLTAGPDHKQVEQVEAQFGDAVRPVQLDQAVPH